MGNITIQGDITATVPGNAVGGASTLTTPGSVPFVTSSGVLGQSGNLFWDNANARLGVGTNAPASQLSLSGVSGHGLALVNTSGFAGASRIDFFGLNSLSSVRRFAAIQGIVTGEDIVNGEIGAITFSTKASVGDTTLTERARFTSSGNLLLGTTTDDGTNRLQVAGSVAVYGATGTNFRAFDLRTTDSATPNSTIRWVGSDGFVKSVIGRNYIFAESIFEVLGTDTNASTSTLQSQFSALSITRNRNTIIGPSPVEGNFRLDVNSSGSSGSARIYDQTPTVGSTSLVVRAGAGQSTTNLQTWQNNAGTALSYIGSDGAMRVSATFYAVLNSAGSLNEAVYGTDVQLASGRAFLFSATTDAAAAKDLAFRRFAAGRLELNSGTAIGTTPANARDIMLRRTFAAETTTDPSAADLTIAGSNTQDVAAIYVKNDKLVVAYNRSGTVNYLTIPLDGATTTFTQSTTAP